MDTNTEVISNDNHIILNKNNSLHLKWSDDVKIDIKDTIISKEYNKLEDSKRIETNITFEKVGTLFTVISPKDLKIEKVQVKRGDLSLVDESEAKAIKVEISKDRQFIFFNSTKEVNSQKKTYFIEDLLFYGKTGFIEINNGEKTLNVIKY